MGRQDPDFACITLLCGHWFDRNEAFVVVWVVDLDCWRLQRDKGKRSTQPRVAAMANPRATGDAAVNLQTQCLRGCLRIGRNNNIDEIGHWISPSRKLTPNSGASLTSDYMQSLMCTIAHWGHISRYWHKNSI